MGIIKSRIMLCHGNDILKVPKSNLSNYKKYILEDIYSFDNDNDDFWFLKSDLSEEEKRKQHSVSLKEETDEYYEIEFRSSKFTALRNVLPITLTNSVESLIPKDAYYSDRGVLRKIKDRISKEIRFVINDNKEITITIQELPNIIKQLIIDGCIQKYFQLNNYMFICVADKLPLFIGSWNGIFFIDAVYNIIFDVNCGFTQNELTTELNKHFNIWQQKGDITAPIIPINDLRY